MHYFVVISSTKHKENDENLKDYTPKKLTIKPDSSK